MSLYIALFLSFFKLGLFGFGGGYAMLPLIFENAREFGVVSEEAFSQLVALSQSIPGPVSVNAATFVGFYSGGFSGALVATFSFALPSFILVYLASHFLVKFKGSQILNSTFEGVRPMTIGLIASAVVYVAETSIITGAWSNMNFNIIPCVIFVCAAFLSGKFKLNPILIILLSAVAGAIFIR